MIDALKFREKKAIKVWLTSNRCVYVRSCSIKCQSYIYIKKGKTLTKEEATAIDMVKKVKLEEIAG